MQKYKQAADYIEKLAGKAEIGLVLGSGLGGYEQRLEKPVFIPYKDIPGFPISTVQGHKGQLAIGNYLGKKIIILCGRFHYYEGYSLQEVTMYVRVMKLLGVKTLLLSNAAGGVNRSFNPGDLMLIKDYINLSGNNPLIGKNEDDFGPRFPDMTNAFDSSLRGIAKEQAAKLGINLKEGVYAQFSGPSYESPAEIKMAGILGADAVGMSTVPETIVARHCGIRVLGISAITNMAAGITGQAISHKEVMDTGKQVTESFSKLMDAIIEKI
ncbi:MAG: purine-nucleoside phosphorylase [Eubacteriales bacterium]|nr:purine-nucleoside phosphorylase [Eubacteriales bacterium]